MTYLINPKPRSNYPGIMTAERLLVRFADIHRTKKVTTIPGFGPIREVEKVGENEQILKIMTPEPLTDTGTKGNAGAGYMHIKRSADALRKHVRRLREADAEIIADKDQEIEDLRRQLSSLKKARASYVKRAWQRGEDVPLAEVVDLIAEQTHG